MSTSWEAKTAEKFRGSQVLAKVPNLTNRPAEHINCEPNLGKGRHQVDKSGGQKKRRKQTQKRREAAHQSKRLFQRRARSRPNVANSKRTVGAPSQAAQMLKKEGQNGISIGAKWRARCSGNVSLLHTINKYKLQFSWREPNRLEIRKEIRKGRN